MASRAILSYFFEEQWTQNYPQYLSGLSRARFPTTFLEIAVYTRWWKWYECLKYFCKWLYHWNRCPTYTTKNCFPVVSIPLNNAGIYLRRSFYYTTELSSCVNITLSGQISLFRDKSHTPCVYLGSRNDNLSLCVNPFPPSLQSSHLQVYF